MSLVIYGQTSGIYDQTPASAVDSAINIENQQNPNNTEDKCFEGHFPTDLYRYIIENLIKKEDYQSLSNLQVSCKTVSNFLKINAFLFLKMYTTSILKMSFPSSH